MKITLENGLVIEGTAEQVTGVLKSMGISGDGMFYNSGSRGLVLIREMNSIHLRNAILKQYSEWVDGLHRLSEPKEVVSAILGGIQDKTWIAMVQELASRDE